MSIFWIILGRNNHEFGITDTILLRFSLRFSIKNLKFAMRNAWLLVYRKLSPQMDMSTILLEITKARRSNRKKMTKTIRIQKIMIKRFYKIIIPISKQIYQLTISNSMKIYNLFHVLLLKLCNMKNKALFSLPIDIKEEKKYEVKKIFDNCIYYGKL